MVPYPVEEYSPRRVFVQEVPVLSLRSETSLKLPLTDTASSKLCGTDQPLGGPKRRTMTQVPSWRTGELRTLRSAHHAFRPITKAAILLGVSKNWDPRKGVKPHALKTQFNENSVGTIRSLSTIVPPLFCAVERQNQPITARVVPWIELEIGFCVAGDPVRVWGSLQPFSKPPGSSEFPALFCM